MSIRIGIALGSNLGDRLLNLQRARTRILELPGVGEAAGQDPCVSAPIYETDPVDCPAGAAPFLNTVIEIALRDRCSPLSLLAALRQIECSLGRPSRYPRHSSRCIDLDILYAGQLRMSTSELTLPHPRLHLRRFVLAPLASLRPDLVLPGLDRPINELLQAIADPAKVVSIADSW